MPDVSKSLVYAIKKTYDEKGIDGIYPGKPERGQGEKRILTSRQERAQRTEKNANGSSRVNSYFGSQFTKHAGWHSNVYSAEQ